MGSAARTAPGMERAAPRARNPLGVVLRVFPVVVVGVQLPGELQLLEVVEADRAIGPLAGPLQSWQEHPGRYAIDRHPHQLDEGECGRRREERK